MYKHLNNIKGFEHFVVFNDGRVKNLKTGRFLVGDKNSCGYKRVCLYSNKKRLRVFVHRLVAMYFIDGFQKNLQVNHIDGNKLNNNYTNLEWVTQSQNEQHKQKNLNPRKTNKEVLQILDDGKELYFFSITECAKYNKKNRGMVGAMLRGKIKNSLNVKYKTAV